MNENSDTSDSATERKTFGERLNDRLSDVDRETVAQAEEMARNRSAVGAPIETTYPNFDMDSRIGSFEPRLTRKVKNRDLKERLDRVEAKLDAILMAMNVEFDQEGDGDE